MKAILILEKMPKSCYGCKFCKFNSEYNNGYYGRSCLLTSEEVQRDFDITESRHKSCPLITEEQYVNMVYPLLYDRVVRGILFQKELANKVSVKNIGEEQ